MDTIAPILFLAFLAEGLVEYLFVPLAEKQTIKPELTPLLTRYVAVLLGIGLAFAFRADVLATIGLPAAWQPLGHLITGIMIGRGSNYMNDVLDRFTLSSAPRIDP